MSGKIISLTIEVVRHDLPDDAALDLGLTARHLDHGILRIVTDDGIEGNCFVGAFWERAEHQFRPILDVIKPELIGRAAMDREWLWTRCRYLATCLRLTPQAWAPVDVALWDLAGKAAGLPVYQLLGAQRRSVPAYVTYATKYDSPEGFVAEAEESVALGFRAYKIHPGALSADDVVAMAGLVRKAVGDDVDLMLDPNCGYDFRTALKVGFALDDAGFHWFEDPVPHLDGDAITELSRRLTTPLSMTDQAPDQFSTTAQFIRHNSVRLPRGSALHLGITGLRKLCSLAEGFGLNCELGLAGNALLNAANLHVMLSVSNCDYLEYLLPADVERFALTSYGTPDSSGNMFAPDVPGLRFELDEDWIAAHRIASLE